MTDNDLSPAQTRSYLHGLAELSGKSDADKPAWLQATPDDGRRNRRSNTKRDQSEKWDQVAVVRWAREQRDPRIRMVRASIAEAVYMATGAAGVAKPVVSRIMGSLLQMGMRAGVPDLMWPVGHGGYTALFVELKRSEMRSGGKIVRREGALSEAQTDEIELLRQYGNRVVVCRGVRAACDAVEGYFGI